MIFDFEPGDKVFNPGNKDWGIGQVQSIIKGKVTVNFQNAGNEKEEISNSNVTYFKKVVLPSKDEIKRHKEYLNQHLKKNHFS